jgi:MFS family permease
MRDLAMVGGPALAALVLGQWGAAAAFVGNALSFVVSVGILLTLPRAARGGGEAPRLRTFVSAQVGIARRYPRVAALCVCYLAAVIPLYYLQTVMVVYARDLGQQTSFVGMFYAAAGVGGAFGGLIMGQYLRRLPYVVAIAIYALGVFFVGCLPLVQSAGLALLLLAARAAAGTTGDLIFMVGVQRDVAAELRGRAFGLWFWCIALGQLVGACLGVVATAHTALPTLWWSSVIVAPIVMLGMLFSITAGRPPARTAPVVAKITR